MLVDSHCHLDDRRFADDVDVVVERATAAGVQAMVSIGSGDGPPDLEAGLRVARRYANVFASVGIHPHDASKADEQSFEKLNELAADPKVVIVGEIGLDYHYDHSPRAVQADVFRRQIRIALNHQKPFAIHTREAWEDTWNILTEELGRGAEDVGIFHCFTGGPPEAQRALEMGFLLSFAGVITFPSGEPIREAARLAPDNRILVETDAPYLAPIPYRGKRNEPAYVVETAARLAAVRGVSVERIGAVTTANFERVCLRGSRVTDYTGEFDGNR